MIELIDTHAHLQEREFAADLDAVIERAREAGVARSSCPPSTSKRRESGARAGAALRGPLRHGGYHPHEASKLDAGALEAIEALLRTSHVVAVGEIGLDFYRMHSPVEEQIDAFGDARPGRAPHAARRHPLPRRLGRPRRSARAVGASRSACVRRPAARRAALLHQRRRDGAALRRAGLPDLDPHLGHAPEGQRSCARSLPRCRSNALVVETDSPYGAPQSHRGASATSPLTSSRARAEVARACAACDSATTANARVASARLRAKS